MEKSFLDPCPDLDLSISQPETGYRFSIDPVILASWINLEGIRKVLDVGCGCGILSLILARRSPKLFITGVEIQQELAHFAKKNVIDNQLTSRINIIHADINHLNAGLDNTMDLVISNPPYKKKGTGRLNPESQKAVARHELCLNTDQLFDCAGRWLHHNGILALIFPSDRLDDLQSAALAHGFLQKTIQPVNSRKNSPAKRLLYCAVKKQRIRPAGQSHGDTNGHGPP